MTAWEYPPTLGWAPPYPSDFDPNADARQALQATVDTVLGTDHGVVLHLAVTEGHPAFVLTEAARDATLLVVGSRGHGAFAGMLLGSVSEYCRVACVVPRGRRAQPRGRVLTPGRDIECWRIRPGEKVSLAAARSGVDRPRCSR